MSTQIGIMHTTKGDLTLTKYFGGDKGTMLQITQGAATIIGPDTPGFIQLTETEAQTLGCILSVYKSIRPCPFCNEHLKLDMVRGEVGHPFWITCKICKAEGPAGTDKDEATRQRG